MDENMMKMLFMMKLYGKLDEWTYTCDAMHFAASDAWFYLI